MVSDLKLDLVMMSSQQRPNVNLMGNPAVRALRNWKPLSRCGDSKTKWNNLLLLYLLFLSCHLCLSMYHISRNVWIMCDLIMWVMSHPMCSSSIHLEAALIPDLLKWVVSRNCTFMYLLLLVFSLICFFGSLCCKYLSHSAPLTFWAVCCLSRSRLQWPS